MPVVLAIVLFVLVVSSLLFHFLSPWTFTEIATQWDLIDTTVDITFIVCGIVFVLVNLFTAYCVIKFRHRPGHKAHYEPESHKLEIWLTHLVVVVFVAFALYPELWVIATAFSAGTSPERSVVPMPQSFSLVHVKEFFSAPHIASQILSSLGVALATAFVGVAIALPAAYALSRFSFVGKELGVRAVRARRGTRA